MNKDEKQTVPPSAFDGNEPDPAQMSEEEIADRLEAEKPEFTQGFLVLANDDLSSFKIIEDFEQDGQVFKKTPMLLMTLINMIHKNIEQQQIAQAVVDRWLSTGVPIQTHGGMVKMSIPDLIAQLSSEQTITKIMKQRIKENPGGIIVSGRGGIPS